MKIVQNRKPLGSDTDKENEDDDEEMPEKTGTPKVYDTSEQDGRYAPIRTIPEEDALQLHTDREMSGENLKTNIRRSSRVSKKPNRYGTLPYTGNFWVENRMSKKALHLLQEICGPEQKGHHGRRESRSLQIFCQNKERPQDNQTKIEKEKRKRGNVRFGSIRFMTLPRFGS